MFFGCRVSGEKNDLNNYNKRLCAYYTEGLKSEQFLIKRVSIPKGNDTRFCQSIFCSLQYDTNCLAAAVKG